MSELKPRKAVQPKPCADCKELKRELEELKARVKFLEIKVL